MSIILVGFNLFNFRQVLHGTAGGMSPQVQARNQQLPGSTPVWCFRSSDLFIFHFPYPYVVLTSMWYQDIKSEINPVLNPRAAVPEGSLMGIPGILSSISFSFVIELSHSSEL